MKPAVQILTETLIQKEVLQMKTQESNQLHINSLLSGRDNYNLMFELLVQKELIETFYPNANCELVGKLLVITIRYQHELWSSKYEVRIRYAGSNIFDAQVMNQILPSNPDIHIYRDHSLCLWYPPHHPPYYKICLATDVVIWIRDWIHNYELFKLNKGHWISEYVPHQLLLAA